MFSPKAKGIACDGAARSKPCLSIPQPMAQLRRSRGSIQLPQRAFRYSTLVIRHITPRPLRPVVPSISKQNFQSPVLALLQALSCPGSNTHVLDIGQHIFQNRKNSLVHRFGCHATDDILFVRHIEYCTVPCSGIPTTMTLALLSLGPAFA